VDSHVTRFVVDCGVVLRLASGEIEVATEHKLLAPNALALPDAVDPPRGRARRGAAGGRRPRTTARIRNLSIRLLGDAVLQRRAWDLAEQLGWAETFDAEYVALTQLQADAFVTLDAELAGRVKGIVPTATIEALRTA
jgi:hypothetical protein